MGIFDFFKNNKKEKDIKYDEDKQKEMEENQDDNIDEDSEHLDFGNEEIYNDINTEFKNTGVTNIYESECELDTEAYDHVDINELEVQDGSTVVFDMNEDELTIEEKEFLENENKDYDLENDTEDNTVVEEEKNTEVEVEEGKTTTNIFSKMIKGLTKTRQNLVSSVENVFKSFTSISEEFFDELEESLILADIGVNTSTEIIERLRERIKELKIKDTEQVKQLLIQEITTILTEGNSEFKIISPTVLLIIGVNGVGKTTTIGKLTHKYKNEGKKVLLAAGDTFRAAAIEQLEEWGKRSQVEVIRQQENSDPSAVIYDAVKSAKAKKIDVLICDTAGRLHNKKNLMEELKKISKIITREFPEAHQEVLLVLDGTTGQNALQQAKLFSEVADITGLVLTKIDGTAKGGIIIAIKNELNIPVRYVGIGEGLNDLEEFDAEMFSKALFDNGEEK